MVDPLSEVVTLLRPGPSGSKVVNGAGAWRVNRTEAGRPFYCVLLKGSCQLAVEARDPVSLQEGDFILIPSAFGFTMSSLESAAPQLVTTVPVVLPDGEIRVGMQTGKADVRLLVGHCVFNSPDSALLVSLLPEFVHVRGEERLTTLVQLVSEEARARRPARDIVLARLLEVLLIEAFRYKAGSGAAPGLVRGLADGRLAAAIRRMHESPKRNWTVAQLARTATLSRSAFFERFSRAVGVPPMEYLLAWRMAIAKNLLRHKESSVAKVAASVGYSSASTFSVAFSRHVGIPPTRFARSQMNLHPI